MNKIGAHPLGHDSSICTIDHAKKDIFAISTERVSRFKHDYRFVSALLENFCKIDINTKLVISFREINTDRIKYGNLKYELDLILKKYKNTIKSKKNKYFKTLSIFMMSPYDLYKIASLRNKLKLLSTKSDTEGFSEFISNKYGVKKENIVYYDHHFSHACSTYYSAPLKFKNNSLIMTLDGQGDDYFCKIYKVEDNKPLELSCSSNNASIPLLFSIFTGVAGFTPNADEGKLEALACYGLLSKDNELYKVLDNAFQYNKKFEISLKKGNNDFPFYSISKQYGEISIYFKKWLEKIGEKNFAAAIQLFFEEFFLKYIKDIKIKYNINNIAFSGGGFANVKLNLRIVEAQIFNEIYIFHAMGDDGNAFGALVYDDFCDGIDVDWIRRDNMPYYGTSYTKNEVEKILENNREKINFEYLGESSYRSLAEDVANNKICALFQGRMEYGPRALGHRSIVANPRNPQIREDINLKFKKREWFQPFCPSILEEEREKLFEISYPNKYMTCAFTVRKEFAKELPSIVHIDNTARPQFVEKHDDEYYFKFLKELQKINKYGVVLNTSFNIHGKTIVMTPTDALDDFFACGIDALYIENFKVVKK
jgi:carbamoyltransferase